MAEIALGPGPVAHQPLQHLGLGKAAVALALPDRLAVERDLEHAAGSRHERHRANILAESRQKLLRHPSGAQQPVALRAINDADVGTPRVQDDQAALSLAMVSSSTSKLA